MIQVEFVKSSDPRIAEFESLIHPQPPRIPQGLHILFKRAANDNEKPLLYVGYLHIIPAIWIGGEIVAVEKSHWVYVARLAFSKPEYVAASFRAFYSIQNNFLFPLTLIAKPTPGHAEDFNKTLGYAPDKWIPQYWTKHCMSENDLPLFKPRLKQPPTRPRENL